MYFWNTIDQVCWISILAYDLGFSERVLVMMWLLGGTFFPKKKTTCTFAPSPPFPLFLLHAKLQKFPPNEKKTKQNTRDNLHG
jgi:hypothetical protein